MPDSYYELLGVPRDASDREITQAFRLLARRLHPDVSREPGAEERFKEVNEAYLVLSSPEERLRYDSMGHDAYRMFRAGARWPPHGPRGDPGFHGFGDAFDLFPGQAWGPPSAFRPRAAPDLLVRIEITLGEAILGCDRVVEVPRVTRCNACDGTGSTSRRARPCPRCGGTGREGRPGPGGPSGSWDSPCRECGGRGRLPEEPCIPCGGWGTIRETRRVPVRIPPGIGSGMRIRKEGLGEGMEEGIPNGNLYIEVQILPHARFTRTGEDLEMLLHISPAMAALGTVSEVETIDGKVISAEIPPGVQHDSVVRVKGRGVRTRERCGDLILRIRIEVPERMTAGERDLYLQLLRAEEEKKEMRRKGVLSACISRIRGEGR